MRRALLISILVFLPQLALAGSQTYSTPGTYTFTVPSYGILTVEVWGGGGGGLGITGNGMADTHAGNGSASTWATPTPVTANGGGGAWYRWPQVGNEGFHVGLGGTASGGDSNTTGTSGTKPGDFFVGGFNGGNGGSGANGGSGGSGGTFVNGTDGKIGTAPGGAGGGAVWWFVSEGGWGSFQFGSAGGGGGGYASKTYQQGTLTGNITVVVGAGGNGVTDPSSGYNGGSGAPGKVVVTWTDPPQALQCNGTPQTFSTPGTYTRTVPMYGSMIVEVWGAGGGGGGVGYSGDYGVVVGGAGGSSSFSSVVANGGGGGYDSCYVLGNPYCPASGGAATGGDVNTAGGVNDTYVGGASPNGGAGGPSVQYGNLICGSAANGFAPGGGGAGCYAGGGGGGGGYTKKTYSSGQLSVGSGITIVVGGGGAEGGGVSGYHGGSGAAGKVLVTCSQNSAPTVPVITGPTSGFTKTNYAYTFRSTDPDSDTIRYAVDWDNNGSIDEYVPALGYVSSGTTGSTAHSWNSSNSQTFKALAQDSKGATSAWASYTVNMSPNAPTVLLTATPSSITNGQSSTLTWSSTNATSCTGTNFSTGGATQNTSPGVSVSPTQTTTYTVTCTGAGGTASDSKAVTVTCTPQNICSGNNVVNSCTGAIVQTCSYQCGAGACVPPPAPTFNGTGSGQTALSGHLQARPSLVIIGDRTKVFWNISNVTSCTAIGDNTPADSWTVAGVAPTYTSTSGSAGKQSAAITQRTTYTLTCTPFSGQTFAPETAVVNVVPVFEEQ